MIIYYLMIKTHNISGLKYLCQTRRKNPCKYLGSGTVWKKHLEQHGRSIRTEILLETSDKKLITSTGRYYSALYNITTAMDDFGNKIWANVIPETGGGPGWTSEQAKQRIINNPELIDQFKQRMMALSTATKRKIARADAVSSSEFKEKFKSTMKIAMSNPTVQLKLSKSQKEAQNRPEVRLNNSINQKEAQNRPDVKLRKSESGRIAQNRPEVKCSKSGKNNYRYDSTIFTFSHIDGTIEHMPANDFCVKYNLDRGWLSNIILGHRKTIKGWSVKR